MDYQSDKAIINKKILTGYSGTFIITPTLTTIYSKEGEKLDQIEVNVWTFGQREKVCGKGERAYKKLVSFAKENNFINPRKIEEVIDECLVEIRKIVSESHILTNKKTRTSEKFLYKSFELKELDGETRKIREDGTKELNLDQLNKD